MIPDLPGQGDSQAPNDFDYSIPNLTEKLRRFAEAIQIDKNLHIAGHSMGGAVALLYTAQYPLDTKSLFLIDSAGVFNSVKTAYIKDPTLVRSFKAWVTCPFGTRTTVDLALFGLLKETSIMV